MQSRFFPASAASRFGLVLMVAALLMLSLPATAALAQATATDDADDVQYTGVCQNIIGSIGAITQAQTGTATAVAVDEEGDDAAPTAEAAAEDSDSGSEAEVVDEEAGDGGEVVAPDRGVLATVAQEQGVTIAQVNECLNGVSDTDTDTAAGTATEKDVLASTIPEQKVLANTGGPALLLPALGLLLISSVAITNILRR